MSRALSLHPRIVYAMRVVHWLAYERYLAHAVRSGKVDIIHESFYTPARFGRRGATQVFTLHDLSLALHAQTHSRDRRLFFDRFFMSRLLKADHIIVPSEYIRHELLEYSPIDPLSVTVIPEGVAPCFPPCPDHAVETVLARLGLPTQYLLFVGTLEPRKNIAVLLRAMSRSSSGIPLVIQAGAVGGGLPFWRS